MDNLIKLSRRQVFKDELTQLKLHGYIDENDFAKIDNAHDLYLLALDTKNAQQQTNVNKRRRNKTNCCGSKA